MRARVSAHGGNDGHEHGKSYHLFDGRLEKSDHHGCQNGRAQIDQQPGKARARGIDGGVVKVVLRHTAHAHDIFFVLLVNDVDHVINGDGADQPPAVIDHGRRHQIALAEQEGDFFLVDHRRNGLHIGLHEVAHHHRAAGPHEAAQPNDTDRAVGRVDHVNIVEHLGQGIVVRFGGFAKKINGLAHRPEGRDRHHLALHQAARAVFGVGQSLLDQRAIADGNGVQNLLLIVFLQILDDLDGVIGLQFGDGGSRFLDTQFLDHVIENLVIQFGQNVGVEVLAQNFNQRPPVIRLQAFKKVGGVGRVQQFQKRADTFLVALFQRLDDVMFEIGINAVDDFFRHGLAHNFRGLVLRSRHNPVPPSLSDRRYKPKQFKAR